MKEEMSLPWFRLYRELKDDPKIGCLTDAEFRTYIESLCWACERANGGGMGLTMENVCWAFRRNVTETFQALIKKQLIAVLESGELHIPAWEKRQMPSDSSTQRVRKYREKQHETLHETLQDRYSNGTEEIRGEEKREEKTSMQLRAEKLLGKRPTTAYDKSEIAAWKIAKPIVENTPEADWLLLEAYYAAPQEETYSRKNYATLLNNWNGEIDRAKSWKQKKVNSNVPKFAGGNF
jgi:hypothetical protein